MDVNRGEGLDGEHASPGIVWFPNPLAADFFEVRWGPCLVLVGLYQLLHPPLKNFWVSPRQVPCLTSEIISWEGVVGT